MTIECCDNAGGRVILTIGGKKYSSRGGITIRPTTFERTAGSNDDGTLYVTTKPMPAEADIKLSDKCGLVIDDLVAGCHVDATLELIDMRRKYLFTRSSIVGRPEINTESGEISGLKIASAFVKSIPY